MHFCPHRTQHDQVLMRERCIPHGYNKSDHIAASSCSVWNDVIVPPQIEWKRRRKEMPKQTQHQAISSNMWFKLRLNIYKYVPFGFYITCETD